MLIRLLAYVLIGAAAVGLAFTGIDNWIIAAVIAGLTLIFEFVIAPMIFRPRAAPPPVEAPFVVTCNNEEIVSQPPAGETERVPWKDIIIVAIRIDGPAPAQQWWMVSGVRGKCWFPADAEGLDAARAAMRTRLAGFDDDAANRLPAGGCGAVVLWGKEKHPARVQAAQSSPASST